MIKDGTWVKLTNGGLTWLFIEGPTPRKGFNSEGRWSELIGDHNDNKWNSVKRPATKEEIQTALVKEAEQRGYSAGTFINSKGGNRNYPITKHPDEFFYDLQFDILRSDNDCAIYQYGKWAEIVHHREDGCPFREGDIVEYVGTYGKAKHRKMKVAGIDEDNFCLGDIPGEGFHFSQFKLVEKANPLDTPKGTPTGYIFQKLERLGLAIVNKPYDERIEIGCEYFKYTSMFSLRDLMRTNKLKSVTFENMDTTFEATLQDMEDLTKWIYS